MNLPHIDVLGPLPESIQMVTIFSGAVSTACEQPEAAQRVLHYMASPGNAEMHRRYGMEPA
jgi:molybdate transport system substrate-binding protein